MATEYQSGNTAGTVDTHQYWNTSITLEQHDANLAATLKAGGQIKASKMHTPDGGKTWLLDHVSIPAKSPRAA
jgi:predicted enzyme related to lactoylglutathione lyase